MDDLTIHDPNLSIIADLVEQLEQDLLNLEEILDSHADSTALVHHTFRTAHNLKSSFGLIQREHSSALVHAIESNFDLIRNGFAHPTQALLHQSLLAVDAMRFSIFLPEERAEELARLRTGLEKLSNESGKSGVKDAVAVQIPLSESQKKTLRSMVAENFSIFQIEKVISPEGMSRQVYENLPVYDDIREVGLHIATFPDFDTLPKNTPEAVIRIVLATTLSEEELGMYIFDTIRKINTESVTAISPEYTVQKNVPSTNEPETIPAIEVGRNTEQIRLKKQLTILMAEDDFVSRTIIHEILKPFGVCDLAADGREAVLAFEQTMEEGGRYDLVCLDIMMPTLDGTQALERIREYELKKGIIGSERAKIVMTTALDSMDQVFKAFRLQCDAYLIKPITKAKVLNQLRKLHLIEE